MKTAFCQQIDSKQFRSEAQGNTNEALLMLYQQFMEMPDGPQKRHFLESVSDVLLEILQHQLLRGRHISGGGHKVITLVIG